MLVLQAQSTLLSPTWDHTNGRAGLSGPWPTTSRLAYLHLKFFQSFHATCPAAICAAQAPLVRTVYHRTAFQESSNNQVRAACRLANQSGVLLHGMAQAPNQNLLYRNVSKALSFTCSNAPPFLPTLPQVRTSLRRQHQHLT